MRSVHRGQLAAGALAGLASGGLVVALGGGAWSSGSLGLVCLAAVVGAGLAALLGHATQGYAAMASAGLLFGLLLWILGPLSLAPLLDGRSPEWSLGEAAAAFPALVGCLLYGALTALVAYAIMAMIGMGAERAVVAGEGSDPSTRVVILGGGFAGVSAAQGLEKRFASDPDVDVTLVSSSNFLLFTPMLAEVASSAVEPQHVSAPLRAACPRTRFRRGSVEGIDLVGRSVSVRTGGSMPCETLPYDHLVIALGTVSAYRDLPGVEANSFGLKTLEEAVALRGHVIGLLEEADGERDGAARERALTFVVVGGGFAGTEAVAELFDLTHGVLHLFPGVRAEELRFVLVHSRESILAEVGEDLGAYALGKLRERDIEFRLGTRVESAGPESLRLESGEEISARTLVWTAGNRTAPVVAALGEQIGESGALTVEPTLAVPGHPGLWALGDCARVPDPRTPGSFYPPTAQHALREGKLVAANVAAVIRGKAPEPFEFTAIGVLVALGHRTAVADIRGRQFSGLLAWVMWRGIYLGKLPGLDRRLRVLLDWTLDLFFARDVVLTGAGGRRGRDAEGAAEGSSEERVPERVA